VFSLQDTSTYEAEKVASNLQFVDGLAWSRSGFLAVADVRQRKIYKLSSSPRAEVLREKDGGASGLAYDLQGRLYICESESRQVTRLNQNGEIEVIAADYQGKKFNSPNDITVRRDGNVYFTDPAFGGANDHRELDFHGVWRIAPKTGIESVAKWQTRPNGITLSADGKLLFVTDSDRHAVVAFDLDRNGLAANQRDVVKSVAGVPGGIRTDVEGHLYVAARGIARYSPDGRLQQTYLESEYTSNCAFGEGDTESLFVSSRGSIFRIKIGVKGALQY
jgi:gluconolactonase